MRKKVFHIILAVLLVVVGVVLLLSNLNIISLEMKLSWVNIYPVIFIILGLKIWMDTILKQGGSWIFGSFLTIFGGLLFLDRLDVFGFSFSQVWQLWPLLFIYIGFSIFLGRSNKKYIFEYDSGTSHSRGRNKSKRMIVGDHSFNQDNWKVEPMNLWNGVGDYKFDFTRAFIPDEDTPIAVRGWVGDVKVIIPKHVPFRVEAVIKVGDIKVVGHNAEGVNRTLQYETDDYALATRRLTFQIDLGIGDIKVVQV
ncbi:cell wall-active antibiotics response protein LiaF [Halobacillus litoralis]|nr:cell wall-active antibiotics response protein LiaF [Halobacillus litoralis]